MVQVSIQVENIGYPTTLIPHTCTCGYILPRGQYYRMQGPLLGKAIGGFSPSAACRVHFSTLNASQQGGCFQISSGLISLCAAAKMCVSSPTGSYQLVTVNNQEQWQWLVLFCETLGVP